MFGYKSDKSVLVWSHHQWEPKIGLLGHDCDCLSLWNCKPNFWAALKVVLFEKKKKKKRKEAVIYFALINGRGVSLNFLPGA